MCVPKKYKNPACGFFKKLLYVISNVFTHLDFQVTVGYLKIGPIKNIHKSWWCSKKEYFQPESSGVLAKNSSNKNPGFQKMFPPLEWFFLPFCGRQQVSGTNSRRIKPHQTNRQLFSKIFPAFCSQNAWGIGTSPPKHVFESSECPNLLKKKRLLSWLAWVFCCPRLPEANKEVRKSWQANGSAPAWWVRSWRMIKKKDST